jgi:hypothetical protein
MQGTEHPRDLAPDLPDAEATRPASSRRAVRVTGVVVVAIVVLLWPIQSIDVLMLVATVVLLVDLYGRWTHRHALGTLQRRSFHRTMSGASFVFLAIGAVAAVLWPTPMVLISLAAVVVASVLWCVTSCVVWLVAMEHDLVGTEPHSHPVVESHPRRPRPTAPSAPLPLPHLLGVAAPVPAAGASRPAPRRTTAA